MSEKKNSLRGIDESESSRYYEYVVGLLNNNIVRLNRKGQKLAEEQVELWEEDDSCPSDDLEDDWGEIHGEINLDMWSELV
tara:strand:+ start:1971 stop:2213 length:243 start_codon:yes stop_codon:yes gene_type:complete